MDRLLQRSSMTVVCYNLRRTVMKVRNLIGAMAVAGLAFAAPAARAQTAGAASTAKVDDGALKTRIESRLKSSATLKGTDIDVAVDHGVVTLTGTVHSEAQNLRAASLAKVTGVTDVDNKLKVDSATTRAMDKAEDKTDKAADKSESAMHKAGDKTKSGAEKVGDKTGDAARATGTAGKKAGVKTKDAGEDVGGNITDGWITTRVKADFVNEDLLKGSAINADTNNHIVTLKGTVASEAGRDRAVQIAKGTKGVSRVIDQLTIGPAK
jgi:hyperosmotically inducible protein